MNKPIIREEFKPDFARIKQYDRLYFNTPVDILEDEKFLDLPTATQAFYQHMCRLSFRRANTNGWFLVTSKDLIRITKLNIRTIRRAKYQLLKLKFLDIGRAYEHDSIIHTSDCYRINGFKDIMVEDKNDG